MPESKVIGDSLTEGIVLLCCIIPNAVPLFRSRCKEGMDNCRPNSVLSEPSKVFESVILNCLYGFLSKRETLKEMTLRIKLSIKHGIRDIGCKIAGVYDENEHTLTKSFDLIDDEILLPNYNTMV